MRCLNLTKFEFLCSHSGKYDFTDKKTGKHISGFAYYLVIVKEGDCFPLVKKCTETAFQQSCDLANGQMINLYFDENQRVSDINVI